MTQSLHELKEAADEAADLGEIVAAEGEPAWYEEGDSTLSRFPPHDREYIALANPATIKALIADYERTMDLLRYAANTIEAMRPSFAQAKDEGHAYHDQVLHEIRQALTQGESA